MPHSQLSGCRDGAVTECDGAGGSSGGTLWCIHAGYRALWHPKEGTPELGVL